MAAAKEAVRSGDSRELSELLVGSRIWVYTPPNETVGWLMPEHVHGPYRVNGFKSFHPADPPGPEQRRKKHLIQLYTDPGGMRTLSVGSICFQDPRKQR